MGPHIRRSARGLSERQTRDPVIIVHSLTQALAALTAGAASGRSVTLLSAPDAGIFAGPGWFKALVDAAQAAVPAAQFSTILDCGDDAGAAQGAIRAGIDAVIYAGRSDVAERLAAIAAASDFSLLRARPTALIDLGDWFFADPETLRQICAERLASLRAIC
jgi:hypothetical protein